MKEQERWRWVVGAEGQYIVSDKGNVVSLPKNGRDGVSLGIESEGYISAIINGSRKRVHRLVLEAFCQNHDGRDIVNHLDGDGTNNRLDNLEWCTYSHNLKHAYNHGLRKIPSNNTYACKFSDEQVREIRRDKRTASAIANEYGVSDVCICNIKNRKTYKGVEDVD